VQICLKVSGLTVYIEHINKCKRFISHSPHTLHTLSWGASVIGESLEDLLQAVGSPVELLRNLQTGLIHAQLFPVNSRIGEMSSVPGNSSHPITDMYLQGPDALF
jgi:hypothetical protein